MESEQGAGARPARLARLRAAVAPIAPSMAAILVLGWLTDELLLALLLGVLAAIAAIALLIPARRAGTRAQAAAVQRRSGPFSASDLAAAVPDPLIVFDRSGDVLQANEAARAAFGTLLPGTPLQLKFRAPEMQELVANTLGPGGGPQAIDFAERVPIERWFKVMTLPLGEGGDLFVMIFKDQSEVRRIDRMRADFIANASHELRTPLASIAGFVETLRGPARDDPRAREQFLQIMEGQTARMARLIDDLLSLSRLEMKTHLAPGQTVDVARTLRAVSDTLAPLAAETGVVLEMRIAEGLPLVHGDADELFQVFQNLIENACKYGRSGGRVEVAAAASGGELQVSVRDFGPGIAEEHIPRITERFYRIDADGSRVQKGTGLGLAIVKHILARHEARLSIRSRPGDGATFTVSFPLAATPRR